MVAAHAVGLIDFDSNRALSDTTAEGNMKRSSVSPPTKTACKSRDWGTDAPNEMGQGEITDCATLLRKCLNQKATHGYGNVERCDALRAGSGLTRASKRNAARLRFSGRRPCSEGVARREDSQQEDTVA